VTDEHYGLAKMWLFLTHKPGDILMPYRTSNDPNLGTSAKANHSILTVSTIIEPSPSNVGLSSLLDASRLSKDYVASPFLHPVYSFFQDKSSNGYILPSQFEDPLLVPCLIDLETSGLRQSPQIAAINGVNHDSPAIAAYTSSTMQLNS
jgi:hypothetical protein